MMKNRIKADFTLLLNQVTLFGDGRSLLIPTGLPVISNSSPCYRITGRMALKLLVTNENISKKLAGKGPKSFFLPVIARITGRNREERYNNREAVHHPHTARPFGDILYRSRSKAPGVVSSSMYSEIYWISDRMPVKLALMARPRAGDWLEDEIAHWRASSIDAVVSLLETEEVSELGLQRERALCEQHGIDFLSFPITDRGVPASMRETKALAEMLLERIAKGHAVAVHCRAGIGRSSIIAGSVLVLDGLSANEALAAIATARRTPVPDTDAQRLWLADFEAMVTSG